MRLLDTGQGSLAREETVDLFGTAQWNGFDRRRSDDASVRFRRRCAAGDQPAELGIGLKLLVRHRHRTADIENEVDPWRDFFAVQPDGEHFRTRIRSPIDMAQVIAGRVLTIILKLEGTAGACA